MTKIILASVLLVGALYAEDVVHYDTKAPKKSVISKPNHPTNDLYTKK